MNKFESNGKKPQAAGFIAHHRCVVLVVACCELGVIAGQLVDSSDQLVVIDGDVNVPRDCPPKNWQRF